MPKNRLWTYSELSRVIPLRYEGLTYIEISRRLTSENLKALGLPDVVFDALDAINQKRVRDTRQKVLVREMEDAWACVTAVDGGEVPLDSDMLLKDAVLMPPRLQYFEQHNPLYGELMASYAEVAEHCESYTADRKSDWQALIACKDGEK